MLHLLACLSTATLADAAVRHARVDLDCPPESLEQSSVEGFQSRYYVSGCGRATVYRCSTERGPMVHCEPDLEDCRAAGLECCWPHVPTWETLLTP